MTCTPLNPQQMSTFTRGLYNYERTYLKDASQDQTISGKIKTNLVGRVLTLGVSLFLHAEAVCRAVLICFLSIREVFSKSNEELINKQKQECSHAYGVSLKSFFAFFHQKILANSFEPEPKALQAAKLPQQLEVRVEQPAPAHRHEIVQQPAPAHRHEIVQQPALVPVREQPILEQPAQQQAPVAQEEQLPEDDFEVMDAPADPIQVALQQPVPLAPVNDGEPALIFPVLQAAQEDLDEGFEVIPEEDDQGSDSDLSFEEIDAPANPIQVALQQQQAPDPLPVVPQLQQVLAPLPVVPQLQQVLAPLPVVPQLQQVLAPLPVVPQLQQALAPLPVVPQQQQVLAPLPLVPQLQQALAPLPVVPPLVNQVQQAQANAPVLQIIIQGPEPVIPLSPHAQAEQVVNQLVAPPEMVLQAPEFEIAPHEAYRIQMARERVQRRKAGLAEEFRIQGDEEVIENLTRSMADAQLQIDHNVKIFNSLFGPEEQYQDEKWRIVGEEVGDYDVGICQFARDRYILQAESMAQKFDVRIGNDNHPLHLFGIFDPIVGPRASRYVKDHIQQVLTEKLIEQNRQGLSIPGIWNALSQSFLTLNHQFLLTHKDHKVDPLLDEVVADHGSSATVAIIFNEALWVVHLGSSRAVLNQPGLLGGTPVQMSEDPSPRIVKYSNRVEDLGGYVRDGLVNGNLEVATAIGLNQFKGAASSRPCITRKRLDQVGVGSYLFLGTRGFFEATSSRKIASVLHTKKALDPKDLAHDLAYSIFILNQQSQQQHVKNRPLSCLLVKFPLQESDWDQV